MESMTQYAWSGAEHVAYRHVGYECWLLLTSPNHRASGWMQTLHLLPVSY